ncbi:MAG: helix-turn-helix transcriptional regulator [Betaproteobacteria bacterium]|nr:helix-turn-helix transcriptional regulator [Betaproteobacteria bacterium]
MELIEETRRLNLLRLIDAHGGRNGGQRKLSEACGGTPSPAQISQWVNRSPDARTGKPRAMRGDSARAMEEKLGLPTGWMDQQAPADETVAQSVATRETRPGYVRFQDMGQGGAGPGVINPDYPEVFREVEIAEWQIRQELGRIPSPQRVKLLTVRGNSMAPRIRHGDVVFVDVEDCQPEDGCLFAVLLQGATLIKLLEFRRDGVHIVSLAAPERPDIVPPNEMESLRIAGRVLGAIQLRKAEEL